MTVKEVLDQASAAFYNRSVSRPNDDAIYDQVARLWSAYIGVPVTRADAVILMMLLKVARQQYGMREDDNWVDMVGYAAMAASYASNIDEIVYDSQDCENCERCFNDEGN